MSGSTLPPNKRRAELVAGAGAGLFATALLHPLDLVKTRMQVQDARSGRRLPVYRGLVHGVRSIVTLEGWFGLFQGLGPNLVGSTTSWGLYMYFYALCKDRLAPYTSGSALYLGAATVAGAVVTMIVHPIFTIKTRLQLQLTTTTTAAAATTAAGSGGGVAAGQLPGTLVPAALRNDYRGLLDAALRMVREEGALSLYRGLGPSLLLVSHGSIQFVAYENLKLALAERDGRAAPASGRGAGGGAGGGSGLGSGELAVASTCSKLVATAGTYPYQVIRSCMQQRAVVGYDRVRLEGTLATAARIWREEGGRGFYRGIWAHMVRSTPQASVTLLAYENILRLLSTA